MSEQDDVVSDDLVPFHFEVHFGALVPVAIVAIVAYAVYQIVVVIWG